MLKVSQPMLVDQADLNTVAVCNLRYVPATHITHTITWGAGTTAGVVTIEAADTADESGTWSSLATVTWAAASTTETVPLQGTYKHLRHRISTAVVGGTVSSSIRAV